LQQRPTSRSFSAWRQHDDLRQFASILQEHDQGLFFRSASLVDELFTDDRVQGVTETRVGELLSSPRKIKAATADSSKAIRIAEEIGGEDGDGYGEGIWESICPQSTAATLLKWGIFLGVAVAKIEWEHRLDRFTPRLIPYHPANLRWDDYRKLFILNTMTGQVVLPRPDEQPEGDGKWVVWCPNGVQYGWREGVVRSLGEVYLSRRYAKLNLNRWGEKVSLGIIKGKTPAGATEETKDRFRADLGNLNSESVVIVPQGTSDAPGFDVESVQMDATQSWQGIKGQIDDANTDISVLILGGNLPTEQKGDGSYASSKVQKQTSVNRALRDATLGPTIGRQVLTHWAEENFGDRSLAPIPCYEVTPEEDELHEAQAESAEALALKTKAEAVQLLVNLDPHVDVETMLESEGIPLLSDDELAARMEDEAQRAADAMATQPQGPQGNAADPPADPNADPSADPQQRPRQGLSRAALGTLENVRKRYSFQGLDVAVENPAQTLRRWTDATGKLGHTVMRHDYGFLDGYLGADKEELDVYVGPDEAADHVYVVRQHGPVGMDGRWCYDEDKVMMGFASAEDAKAAFLAHRDDGDRAFGGMLVLTLAQFKAKLSRRRADATNRIRASIDATSRSLVALAMRASASGSAERTVAGRKRAAKYQEALLSNSKKRAAAAMAPFLVGMRAEIERAGSLEEVKPRVLKYLSAQRQPRALALVVQGMNLLSGMHGRTTAREGI
jgi:hypothetical protein